MQINQSITNTQCRDNVLKGLFGEYLKTEYVFYILRSYDLKSNEYDVDILCNKYHVDYLLEITNAYFYRLGFVSIYSNNYGFHLKRVYIHNENHSVFLIDFQGGLEKGGVRFLGGQYFLENSINVRKDSTNYLLEPCLELVSLVYHCVFDKKFFDDKHLKAVANLRKLVTYDDVIRVVLIDFNNSTAQSIVNKIFNDKEISNLCLNRNILLRESSSYLDLLNYFYRQTRHLLYRLNKFSNPHGFLVCFIGVDIKKAIIKPAIIIIPKITSVMFQPNSSNVYLVYIGEIKYPNEPAAVTIPVAIVLVFRGKCFATIETGILIAVAPNPIPTRIPISNINQEPVLGP